MKVYICNEINAHVLPVFNFCIVLFLDLNKNSPLQNTFAYSFLNNKFKVNSTKA